MNLDIIHTWETPRGNLEVFRDEAGIGRFQLSLGRNTKPIDQHHVRGIRGTDLEDRLKWTSIIDKIPAICEVKYYNISPPDNIGRTDNDDADIFNRYIPFIEYDNENIYVKFEKKSYRCEQLFVKVLDGKTITIVEKDLQIELDPEKSLSQIFSSSTIKEKVVMEQNSTQETNNQKDKIEKLCIFLEKHGDPSSKKTIEAYRITGAENLLNKIAKLDLSLRKLNGLPPEIGLLQGLIKLELDSNCLQGLPKEFSELGKLRILHLEGNLFSKVPRVLSKMPWITHLFLYKNPLKELPSFLNQKALRSYPPGARWTD